MALNNLREDVRDGYFEYTLKDYVWYPSDVVGALFRQISNGISSIPGLGKLVDYFDHSNIISNTAHIDLVEFEPDARYRQILDTYKELFSKFTNLFSSPEGFVATAEETFGLKSLQEAIGITGDSYEDLIYTIPNKYYHELLAGRFIGSLQIPYFGNHFLHAKGAAGWASNTMQQQVGGDIGQSILGMVGLGNLNIAVRPRFNLDGNGPEADALEIVFYLYNETSEALRQNLMFLIALAAGPFWVQSGFLQRASNLYNVQIPGRLHYYFCTMDLLIEYAGKTRALGPAFNTVATGLLTKFAGGSIFDARTSDNSENFLSASSLVPDGYKITMTLQSIMPNNFNIFASMLTNKDIKTAEPGGTNRTLDGIVHDIIKKL